MTMTLAAAAVFLMSAGPAASAEPIPVQLAITSPQNQTLLMSQDPLTRQILSQLTQENGGVKAVVRVANGQSVELRSPEPEGARNSDSLQQNGETAIPVLTPHPDLVKETKAQTPAKRKPAKKASEQLKGLKNQGSKQEWESSKAKEPKPQPVSTVEPGLY
ncbi:MAG: hypothetical protein HZB91_14315 [Elusimicrobia bacterium]|nr:hypothetical protein [Elusimicrobiota bacterium]